MLPPHVSVQPKWILVYVSVPRLRWLCSCNKRFSKSSDENTCLQPRKKLSDHSAFLQYQCFSVRAVSKLLWVFTAAQHQCGWLYSEKLLAFWKTHKCYFYFKKSTYYNNWKMGDTLLYRPDRQHVIKCQGCASSWGKVASFMYVNTRK